MTMTSTHLEHSLPYTIVSDNVSFSNDFIESKYTYQTTKVSQNGGRMVVSPFSKNISFRTARKVPKMGVMLVGWGGNNGTTFTAGVLANKKKLSFQTRTGVHHSNWMGSLTQMATLRVGSSLEDNTEVYLPYKEFLPLVNPDDLVIGGWDINGADLGVAMERACVLDYDLQRQLREEMSKIVPLPSVYYPSFIAANQRDRADNVLPGTHKMEHLEHIRKDIREFKAKNGLDTVLVLWTANTERFADIRVGLNDSAETLLKSISADEAEVSPSTIFAVASILEGCTFINGSPQNTLVPGVIQLAEQRGVFVAGDDFKTGQTKIKSVLVDFLVSAGIKPLSVVSYNHLGNNDGRNLSSPSQFRSKEISKSSVVDDMVASNPMMYPNGEHPDHVVVIKYVPTVGDSKRALDEYTSEIFMGGWNTLSLHNTCEDSLLAAPLMLDLCILGEFVGRINYKTPEMSEYGRFESILSILSYLLKAPVVPAGTPVINALGKQRDCIDNIFRALLGLPPDNHMLLEHKIKL